MKTVLTIENMTCKHCVMAVKNALQEIGIKAKVNLNKGNATFKNKNHITDDSIKEAIEKAGYKLVSIKVG